MRKSILTWTMCGSMMFAVASLAAAPVCVQASTGLENIEIKDVLVSHKSYLSAEEEGKYTEFLTLFYGNDTKKLMAMFDETHFLKSAGYTKEQLEDFDVESVYPGFNDMSYADKEIFDEGDYYTVLIRFKDLDEHWKEAIEDGILTTTEDVDSAEYMDAESICQSAVDSGFQEVSESDYTTYNLHFDLD